MPEWKSKVPDFVMDYEMWAEPNELCVKIYLRDREAQKWTRYAVGQKDVDLFVRR